MQKYLQQPRTTSNLHRPPVTRSRSKNSKIMSFKGRTRFCSMSFATRVTPGTVHVKISAAAKVVMKECKVQNGY